MNRKRRQTPASRRKRPEGDPPPDAGVVPAADSAHTAEAPPAAAGPRPDPGSAAGAEAAKTGPGAPASEAAQEVLRALRERLFEALPGWAGRPEDPASVLLELFAGYAGEVREEIRRSEERVVPRLLERLGFEPRPPRPARGWVLFEASPPAQGGRGGGSVTVPAGTEVLAARESGGEASPGSRAAFETDSVARLGSSRLARALAVDGLKLRELPIDADGSASASGRPPVSAFGARVRAGRELYLGDQAFLALRDSGASLSLHWPGYPAELSELLWEYRVAGGWRILPARFERAGGEPPVLRAVLEGPLPDLAREARERADLPWIRCRLGGGPLDLAAPLLVEGPDGEEGAVRAGRPVERIFLAGPEGSLDLSLEARLAAPPPGADLDPAVYLGWDGPSPSTVYLLLAEGGGPEWPPEEPHAARILWESWTGSEWAALPADAVDDSTAGLQRSGTFTAAPAALWEARDLFGERLWWIRGRWTGGERPAPLEVRALVPRAAAVTQGRTARGHVLGSASQIREGVLVLAPLAEGQTGQIDRLEIRRPGGPVETWERRASLAHASAEDRVYSIELTPEGGARVRFGDGVHGCSPPSDHSRIAATFRIGIGSHGNVPAGALRVLPREIPGVGGVQNPLPTHSASDLEPLAALRERASAEWRTGGRAVTAGDFERLVRARAPGVERVVAGPDPRVPGGILVVVVPPPPRRPGRLSPVLLQAIERDLGDRAPLGTPVRVAEPAYVELEAEVGADPAPGEREDLRARLSRALELEMEEVLEQEVGRRVPAGEGLNEGRLRSIMGPALREAVGPAGLRLRLRDGGPIPGWSPEGTRDPVLFIVGIRFAGDEVKRG